MESSVEQRCSDLKQYMTCVLRPAMADIRRAVSQRNVQIHQVFSINFFVAHAIDYVLAVRAADGIEGGRVDLIRRFDEIYSVGGARLKNHKFELIDAINNALKHIKLKSARYPELEKKYGPIAFNCLVQTEEKVLCLLEDYRFDYVSVALLPAIQALSQMDVKTTQGILEFARGEGSSPSDIELVCDLQYSEWEDPIDQMIEYCNPPCRDCNEYEYDCCCATYIFEGEVAKFEPAFNKSFDFHGAMSRISGAYSRSS